MTGAALPPTLQLLFECKLEVAEGCKCVCVYIRAAHALLLGMKMGSILGNAIAVGSVSHQHLLLQREALAVWIRALGIATLDTLIV